MRRGGAGADVEPQGVTREPAPTGTSYLVPSTQYLVPGTWYLVPGTWYLVRGGTWYLVPGSTWYLVPSIEEHNKL